MVTRSDTALLGPASAVSRNQPCPCGSGKRYKDCCGRLAASPAPGSRDQASQTMRLALAAQQARRLDQAEALYREALALGPDQADALHMLGVIRYEKRDYEEARRLILNALDLTGWRFPAFRNNLGLVLARANAPGAAQPAEALRQRYREWLLRRGAAKQPMTPRVSVIVPSYNHARFVEAALESVYRQTYRELEIIVIDDGSDDDSVSVIEAMLRRSPFPTRLVVRENRGAPQTINEGIALSTGDYVNVLNSDDLFLPDRVARMVDEVAAVGAEWGFADVQFVDAGGTRIDSLKDPKSFSLTCDLAAVPFCDTVGFSLLASNVAISTGNLFMSRRFVERVGGFRDYRYNHDWDFCLRSVLVAEPVFVPEPLYIYRLHEGNTIGESRPRAREEARLITTEFLRRALETDTSDAPFAPTKARWGLQFIVKVLEAGLGDLVDPETLRQVAITGATGPPVHGLAASGTGGAHVR